MSRKKTYKVEVEVCAEGKENSWDDVLIYKNSKLFIKSVFDSVTKLTLAGFLLEVGRHLNKGYIEVVAIFLFLLFLINVALDMARLIDVVSSYLFEKKVSAFFRMLACIASIAFLYVVIDYMAIPIIADVIKYISSKTNV
ncbi:hypothetical protein [Halomonas sp. BL6]|uniref:hypothetical protein n=1 Tax=Halomonas sp. BL6 TaxID=2585770 RepID=UPI00111BA1E2|nr:hypothetical protein [Halomonas sp. BL6]TNH20004.1 hypothetical protein FHJ80_02150 [Halomonas sp. BL6]